MKKENIAETEYKGYVIAIKDDSHSASIYMNGELVKMIAGNVFKTDQGHSHDALEKSKKFIDSKK